MKTWRFIEMVLLTITLCMNFAACSDDDADIPSTNVKTIHVEKGGTLATLMTEEEQSQVTDLILSGFLNGTDVNFIRGMRNLRKIDFTDAHIIGGGNSYAVDGRFFATSDNIFPPRCFYNLYNSFDLQDVKISNSVIVIGESAFQYCRSLTSVEIPNSVTTIEMFAFDGCTSLTSIEIPNSVTTIEDAAFSDCTSLTSIKIPNSVTTINGAFSDCTSLTSVEIPNSVTTINGGAFSGCTSLASIEIPNSVTTIGMFAFSDCTSLTSVEIPNSVTTIGMFAFSDCTSLTSIEIPNSVTVIEGCAFQNCNLKEIHINSLTPPAVDGNAFSTYSYVTLYVPTESKDAYMAHDIWGKFGNIVEE